MKVLKIIGIILLAAVVLIIVLGLIAPKKYAVERSIVIDAPKVVVFNYMKYWKNWQKWSPWAERDSTMEITFEGTDGAEGSVYRWEGDPKVTGKGEMTNTGTKDLEEVTYHLYFQEPWESESDGYLRVSDVDGGTKASWGFYGETPFPWNIMMLFMNMEKMMAPDFNRGLELLKQICEKEAAEISKYDINPINFPATNYAAIRENVALENINGFFKKSFGIIKPLMRRTGIRMTGVPSGLYFSMDEQEGTTDMAAAVPIKGSLNEGAVQTIKLPASKGFMVNYYGSYQGAEYAHKALDYHIQQNWLTQKQPIIEAYVTDPEQEPDTSKWLTKIYYLVQ